MKATNDPVTAHPPVHYARLKVAGAVVIGSLIAFDGRSDAELESLLGHVWGPRARLIVTVFLGGFYALERYLSRTPSWWKPEGDA